MKSARELSTPVDLVVVVELDGDVEAHAVPARQRLPAESPSRSMSIRREVTRREGLEPRCSRLMLALCLLAAACHSEPSDTVAVRLLPFEPPLSAAAVQFTPARAVRGARLGADGWLAIERAQPGVALRVSAAGFCPLTIPPGLQSTEPFLTPVIDLGADRPPVGFDTPFTILVKHGCPERGRGRITWRQLSGPPLHDLRESDAGFRLSARTASLAELHPEPLAPGIVPFSPRTQGRVLLAARWELPGTSAVERTISLTATSRASGLSSVAVSQQLVLGGADYQLKAAPPAGHAQPLPSGALSLFTPDAPGRWVLARADGSLLELQALSHERTPYDCGRSACHGALARSAADSPMSHSLERQLAPSTGTAADSCMLDCHVLGERGLRDGGFLDVARELGIGTITGLEWQELPRALRRAGGVRCTACHGPGAIPPPQARDAILRVDVCATCHDAPPRYVHVTQWRSSRMARADAAPDTRTGSCAQCHTTRGFLVALGARAAHGSEEQSGPWGIGCAACHAPHAEQHGPRLLRRVPGAERELDEVSALCVRCHAPLHSGPVPEAAAGSLYLGRVRIPRPDGNGSEELVRPAAHASVARGCIGCHGADAATGSAPVDHTFRVQPASCTGCHADRTLAQLRAADSALRDEALALRAKLTPLCELPREQGAPLHARASGIQCQTPRQERALRELSLVLEDPAAAQHNAALARVLLHDAAAQLSSE